MKKLIIALASLFSVSALACPNLAGSYQCSYEDENGNAQTYEQTVSQAEVNGVTVYTTESEGETMEFIADGQTRTDVNTDDGYALKQSLTVTCAGNALNVKNVIDAAVDESFADTFYHGDALAVITSAAQSLDVHTTGSQWYYDDKGAKQEEQFDMTESCKRL